MKRIDRIISEQTNYSRTEIKKLVQSNLVMVNGLIINHPEEKFDENDVIIKIQGKNIEIKNHLYLLLNKPKGYVSATTDNNDKIVLELVPSKYKSRQLFPAGRLDKDTTGLMLITDDGEFAHNILSPKKHIKKIYEVTIDIPITLEMIEGFKSGIMLNDGECKTAILKKIDTYKSNVTLTEGRYHQIKRMFGCFGAKVIELNRICMGNLFLPDDIKLGEVREATQEEIEKILEL